MTEERTYIDAPNPPTIHVAMSSIDIGNRYPFDATNEWWNSEDEEKDSLPVYEGVPSWTVTAARGIIGNLTDRRGIKQELSIHNIDEDVRQEIIHTIAKIIAVTHTAADIMDYRDAQEHSR
jgi:hypothetical protein